MKTDRAYLEHIAIAIAKIEKYIKGLTLSDFVQKDIVHDAVIREFEVIGEASNKLSEKVTEETRDVKWQEIIAPRNKLIHEYFGVDLPTVWEIIQQDLPKLKSSVSALLEKGN